MQPLNYFKSDLALCPVCGEKRLVLKIEPKVEGTTVKNYCFCSSCHSEITETFSITSVKIEKTGEVFKADDMTLIDLKNRFENEVLKLVVDGVCGHDQVYDLSHELVGALSLDDRLTILKDEPELFKSLEKADENDNILSILETNIRDYLDEELIYEIASHHDFEMI